LKKVHNFYLCAEEIMTSTFLIIAGFSGAIAVITGALGAHYLKDFLSDQSLASYETAVRYHFYHTIMLALTSILKTNFYSRYFRIACYCFIAGIVLFSGSIYLLSTKDFTNLNSIGFLGPVTPLGGLFFIAGWILFSIGASRIKIK
jgi:uncharacterized membrane protein YgdD (TMEM256/DUF423 family)